VEKLFSIHQRHVEVQKNEAWPQASLLQLVEGLQAIASGFAGVGSGQFAQRRQKNLLVIRIIVNQ
jgi:hypothetical protein